MRYRIEYADGRCCNFASGRSDLLEWLKLLKEEEISDIRKLYKTACRIPSLIYTGIISGQHEGGLLMDTNLEKLVDMLIQERMQSQYAEWRASESGEAEKAKYLHIESEYEKAINALSEEDCKAVKRYCDSTFDSGAEGELFFYRLGLKDGIRLWKFMKKLMRTVS